MDTNIQQLLLGIKDYIFDVISTKVDKEDGKGLFSGNYNDLTNKPTIPSNTSQLTNDSNFITSSYHDDSKQDTLVSGQNIATINGESLLNGGNITIQGGGKSIKIIDLLNL